MNVTYGYVANEADLLNEVPFGCTIGKDSAGKQAKMLQQRKEELERYADIFNVNLPDFSDGDALWESVRESTPIDEFNEMEELLTSAFPNVFLLGKAYGKKSLMSPAEMEHLLLQHTRAAATDRELLFYLFDCKSRHSIIRNFAAKVRKDPEAFAQFAALVRDKAFQEDIKYAAANPDSDTAERVLRTVRQVLSVGARGHFLAGSLGDTTSVSRAMACARRYGGAFTMVTGTPDDINNPTSLRLALKQLDNASFPACVDAATLERISSNRDSDVEGNVQIPKSYSDRVKAAVGNPVAVACEFRALLENVVQVLVGCPLDFQPGTNGKQVRTWHFKSSSSNSPHHKGIFGHVTAVFGCVETQDRGALHFHIIIWGGLSPDLLSEAAAFPEVCNMISTVIDSMFTAELPAHVHVRDMCLQHMKASPEGRAKVPRSAATYAAMRPVPLPSAEAEWKNYFWHNVLRTGIHSHSFTCKKPPAGRFRCRGAYPAGNVPCSGPLPLRTRQEDIDALEAGEIALSQVVPSVSCRIPEPLPPPHLRDHSRQPLPPTDNRLIVWELKRPHLEPLPPLLNHHLEAHGRIKDHISSSSSDSCHAEDERTLEEAKAFCIATLRGALRDDSPSGTFVGDTTQLAPTILQWLHQLHPASVVHVYLELCRELPDRNGYVVATNPTLSNATGSASNAIFLGNSQQSTCALFYVVPYVCKSKVAMDACLSALEAAQRHIEKFPSIADDSGTDKRAVQHMFTRVLNNLSRSIHVSDTQVALSLLNMDLEVASDSFKFYGADAAVNHCTSMLGLDPVSGSPNVSGQQKVSATTEFFPHMLLLLWTCRITEQHFFTDLKMKTERNSRHPFMLPFISGTEVTRCVI